VRILQCPPHDILTAACPPHTRHHHPPPPPATTTILLPAQAMVAMLGLIVQVRPLGLTRALWEVGRPSRGVQRPGSRLDITWARRTRESYSHAHAPLCLGHWSPFPPSTAACCPRSARRPCTPRKGRTTTCWSMC